MRIPAQKTLKIATRWLRSRFVDYALILGYHRVAEVKQDIYGLSVTPQHFNEHLQVLYERTRPVSLQKLVDGLKTDSVPERAVVLTFDDGYADNFHNALPLLIHHQIPATVFVVAGNLGREFWWDALGRMLYSNAELPDRCRIELNGRMFDWKLGAVARGATNGNAVVSKQNLLHSIYKYLLSLSQVERHEAMAKLWAWSGSNINAKPNCRALNAEELCDLAENSLIEVGAHTMTHRILADLSVEDQELEIQKSKADLEKQLNCKVESFSYPHGLISNKTTRIVQDAGFTNACASFNDVIWRGSDRFYLPRFWIPDWDGNKFSRWLNRWLPG